MYYIGTKAQVIAYDKQVSLGEGYEGQTSNWCSPIECVGYWAVIANTDYPSNLNSLETIEIKPMP